MLFTVTCTLLRHQVFLNCEIIFGYISTLHICVTLFFSHLRSLYLIYVRVLLVKHSLKCHDHKMTSVAGETTIWFFRSVSFPSKYFLFCFLKNEAIIFLLSAIYIRRKYWIRENFRFPVFDGFTCFETS